VPTTGRRLRAARAEVGADALVEVVIVEQRVELREHRVERQPGRRHQGEQILRRVAVA